VELFRWFRTRGAQKQIQNLQAYFKEAILPRATTALSQKSSGPEKSIKDWHALAVDFVVFLQSSEPTTEAIQAPIPPMSDIDMFVDMNVCCYAKVFMA
jgi:hypothetical protein